MDNFSQWKQSQISLLWCMSVSQPSKHHAYLKLAQVDTCQKAILPLLQEGSASWAWGVGMGKGREERREGLKRWDSSEAERLRIKITHLNPHTPRLRPTPAPLRALLLLCFHTSTFHHHPEMAVMVSSLYCQYAIFFMVEK